MRKDIKVAKAAKVAKVQISEERTHGGCAVARKEAMGKTRIASEKTEHVGLVVKQATMQRGVERAATPTTQQLVRH